MYTILLAMSASHGLRIAVKNTAAGTDISSIRTKEGKLIYYDLYESKGHPGFDDFYPVEKCVETSKLGAMWSRTSGLNPDGKTIRQECRKNILELQGITKDDYTSPSETEHVDWRSSSVGGVDAADITYDKWAETAKNHEAFQRPGLKEGQEPDPIKEANKDSDLQYDLGLTKKQVGRKGALYAAQALGGLAAGASQMI